MRPAPGLIRASFFALAWIVLCPMGADAQYTVNPDRLSPAMRNMEWRPDDQPLSCSVSAMKPALNYGFRFQAGYIVRVPMGQYRGKGHRWNIVTRVTPEGGQPTYFMARYNLPEIPKSSTELEVGGGYLVGEGKYRVAWKLQDETGRVCRKEWKFEAKRSRSESKVKVAMDPHTVAPLSTWVPGGKRATDDAPPIRLTVLMHAAPTSPRRTRMTARDRFMLLGTLSSLLERLPTRSVRLVVFNLDQQKELYRQDDFEMEGFNQVADSLDGLELGLVDYTVLQNKRGHVDLLTELVNQEVNAPQPSDVVLFLGPMARFYDKVPETAVAKPPGTAPRFFYFQYRPAMMRMQSTFPDVIHSAVSRLKGKTVIIHSPGDFAKGIAQVENLNR
jgi:hypothetical protein